MCNCVYPMHHVQTVGGVERDLYPANIKGAAGIGYKIFSKISNMSAENGESKFAAYARSPYREDEDGWIVWDEDDEYVVRNVDAIDYGFCFFLNFQEASKLLHALKWSVDGTERVDRWNKCEIRMIEFADGLQVRDEWYASGFHTRMALCKRFRMGIVVNHESDCPEY